MKFVSFIVGHIQLVLLGLLYILMGLLQVLSLGFLHFHDLPDYVSINRIWADRKKSDDWNQAVYEGYTAALGSNGISTRNPYHPEGSRLHRAWQKGYKDGTDEQARNKTWRHE